MPDILAVLDDSFGRNVKIKVTLGGLVSSQLLTAYHKRTVLTSVDEDRRFHGTTDEGAIGKVCNVDGVCPT